MSRLPSEKTQLLTARREIKELTTSLSYARADTNTYRVRATKAEQELADWKVRFDQLLRLSVIRAESQSGESRNG